MDLTRNRNPENTSKGCAVLINLVVSVIVLIVLVSVLIPGLVNLPDWAESIKKIPLIQKKSVFGKPYTFTTHSRQKASKILFFNGRTKNQNTLDNTKIYPLNLVYKQADAYEFLWKTDLKLSLPADIDYVKINDDFSTIYVMDKDHLRAINRNTGAEAWFIELSDRIHPDCEDCMQVNAQNIIVLTQDQMLYSIHLRDGRLAWQIRLNNPNSWGLGFYQIGQKLIVLDKINNNADAPPAFYVYNNQTGAPIENIKVEGFSMYYPYFFYRDKLYLFTEDAKKQVKLECRSLEKEKVIWSEILSSEIILPQTDFTLKTNAEEWLYNDFENLYVKLSMSRFSHQIAKIRLSDGKRTMLHANQDYNFSLMTDTRNLLIVNAFRVRGSDRNEIWAIDKITGKVKWRYQLKSGQVYSTKNNELGWSATIKDNQLYIIQYNTNGSLSLERIDLSNAEQISKNNYTVKKGVFSGISWTSDKVFLAIQNLYSIDLKDNSIHIDWP